MSFKQFKDVILEDCPVHVGFGIIYTIGKTGGIILLILSVQVQATTRSL